MPDIKNLTQKIIKFRDERDWKQFHNPKDLAINLALEAAEVMELFQWKNGKETEEFVKNEKEKIGDEMADVLYTILLLANDLGIDLVRACNKKMKKNEIKYPVSKCKGNHKKYTELR